MRTEIGRRRDNARAGAVGAPEPAVHLPDAHFGVPQRLIEAARLQMRLVHHLEHLPDRRRRHTLGMQGGEDVGLRVLARPAADELIEFGAMLPAEDLIGEIVALGPIGRPHGPLEPRPLGVRADADGDPIVAVISAGAAVDIVRRHPVVIGAHVFGQAAVHRPVHVELAQQGRHHLSLGEIDVLSLTGPLAVNQRRRDCGRGGDAGDRVAV